MSPPDEKVIAAARLASQAWRAAMRLRKETRPLPPWDEQRFFDDPVVSIVDLAVNVNKQIVGPNPARVGLIISVGSMATANVFVSPAKPVDPANIAGIPIINNLPPLMITQADWGNAAQVTWYGLCTTPTARLIVVEIVLRIWSQG